MKRALIACMAAAFVTSAAFLISYLAYHYAVGSVRFTAGGAVRIVCFTILLTHTLLGAVRVPLVLATIVPDFRSRWDLHRRLVRWTLPVWLYASVTRVLVYLMLYRWFPSAHLEALGR